MEIIVIYHIYVFFQGGDGEKKKNRHPFSTRSYISVCLHGSNGASGTCVQTGEHAAAIFVVMETVVFVDPRFFSRFDPLSAKMQFFVKTPKKIKSSTVHRVEKMRNGAKVRGFYPKNTGTKEKTAECAAEQI